MRGWELMVAARRCRRNRAGVLRVCCGWWALSLAARVERGKGEGNSGNVERCSSTENYDIVAVR